MKYLTFVLTIIMVAGCTQTTQRITEKYTIEQFYQNTRFSGGNFSGDESKLLVSSDASGIFNVYEINIKDGTKKQITFSDKESFFALDYVPQTGQILYSADKGGNEVDHIYLLKDDSTSIDLTPGEKEKASFAGWSQDKKSMYYTSNKRDPKFFDMYKMNTSDWSSEILYQNNDGLNISGISDNENIFCLTRTITTSENKMYLFDREKK